MNRREFTALLGSLALGWPLAARAQQLAMPVIGFLCSGSSDGYGAYAGVLRETLQGAGFIENQNVKTVYKWADDQYARLPNMAAELVRDGVSVIVAAGGAPSTLAAKAATAQIPIVFLNGSDPVKLGVVASLNRPGGNITGVTILSVLTAQKRLELISEMLPRATSIAWFTNPRNPNTADLIKDVEAAARTLNRHTIIHQLVSEGEFDGAFADIIGRGADALVVAADPIFTNRRDALVALAAHYALPTMYPYREHVLAGGLISYGASLADGYRQVGLYVVRILRGANPSDLPVLQSTKFDLVINLKTAKALGLTVPLIMQMTADEVIE